MFLSTDRDSLSVSFYRRILGENVDKITQLSDHWSAILDTTKSLPEEGKAMVEICFSYIFCSMACIARH